MARQLWLLSYGLLASVLVSWGWDSGAIAQQNELTRAQIYKLQNSVQLLLRNQPARPAKRTDVLVPQDALRTAVRSTAELLFNEGSLARIAEKTTFRFIPGLRRFQLKNRIAQETIFQLSDGTALILNPPGSVGTKIEAPGTQISILAAATPIPSSSPGSSPGTIAGSPPSSGSSGSVVTPPTSPAAPTPPAAPIPPAATSPPVAAASIYEPRAIASALVVEANAAAASTQFYALTNSNFTVTTPEGKTLIALQGGQTVKVLNGQVGSIQEFDLQAFYQNNPLVAGLGPGQQSLVAQEAPPVQTTLNAVRIQTLAALRSQQRRASGFSSTFLQDALTGFSSFDFDGQKGKPSTTLRNPQVVTGTFTRTGENTAVFVGSDGSQVPISVNFDNPSITINNISGVANSVGLSGNNASGTVINTNGQAIRIEVLGVGGKEPAIGSSFPGTLSTGIAPDR